MMLASAVKKRAKKAPEERPVYRSSLAAHNQGP
jgi:hypothetical protein